VQPLRDPAASAHETWERDQLAEEVARGLALLRPEYSQAFVLFHENEMSYDQIAQAVGRPLGTVKTWIHRARRELIGYLIRRGVVVEPAHAMRSF
jgi:RNA polymerase sigma-70 factor (ECF subfamily)